MPSRVLVITVHGIRTFGQWQKRLETLTTAEAARRGMEVVFKHKHYGYFSVLKFLSPLTRRTEVLRFRDELQAIIENNSSFDRICLVGHSFGTHIIAQSLKSLPLGMQQLIDTVILSGSVLRQRFSWEQILGNRVFRVINDCGSNDWILPFNALLPFDSGVAGRNGFTGITDANFCNRHFEFGHSGYFFKSNTHATASDDNWFMARYWVPLLLERNAISDVDERKNTFFSGLTAGLIDRTENFKWVIPVVFLSLALGLGAYQYSLKKNARDAAYQAEQEKHERLRNLERQLASRAKEVTDNGDAVTGILLAIEAVSVKTADMLAPSIEASRSLYTAVMRNRETASFMSDKAGRWAASPKNTLVAISDARGKIEILNSLTGQILVRLQQDRPLDSISFSPDGRALLTTDGGVPRLWDIFSETQLQAIGTTQEPIEPVSKAIFCGSSRRIAIVPAFGKFITIWNLERHIELKSSEDISLTNIQCNQDGSRLTYRSLLDRVRLLDTQGDILLGTFNSKFGLLPPLFSPDGEKLLLVEDAGADLLLVDAVTGRPIRALSPNESLNSWEFSSDSQYIVAGSDDGTVVVWKSIDGDVVKKWKVNDRSIMSATLDRKNQRILVGSSDNSVRILDLETGNQLANLPGHAAPVVKAIFRPDPNPDDAENVLVTASNDGMIIIWDITAVTNPTRSLTFKTPQPALSDIQFHYSALIGILGDKGFVTWNARPSHPWDNTGLLTASANRKVVAYHDRGSRIIKVVDLDSGLDRAQIYLRDHTDKISLKAALTPDGKHLVSSASDRSLKLWNATNGTLIESLGGLSDEVAAVATSPDGSRLALGLNDGMVSVWTLEPLKRIVEFKGHTRRINSIMFSPNQPRIITASSDRSFGIWDPTSGQNLNRISQENNGFISANYNKDGSIIATVDSEGSVTLWDAKSLLAKHQTKVRSQSLEKLAYDPSGTRVVYSGHLLDSERLETLVSASPYNGWTISPYFTADGSKNVAMDFRRNLTLRPYFAKTADLARYAQSTVPRCLTPQQRTSFDLPPQPPLWCVEMRKWPYATPDWISWLAEIKAGKKANLPNLTLNR